MTNPERLTIEGTATIKLKVARGRRLAENGRSLQDLQDEPKKGKFSFNLNLDPTDSDPTDPDVDVSAAISHLLGAVPLVAAAAFTL